jgi:dipeptidyl aminopeptidase/acylaminoacyl peptidase
MRALTDHNNNLLSKVRMSAGAETFSFLGADNETVWGWHVPPVTGATPNSPLAFLIHGGPQSSWYDAWSYRWNYQAFSSQGYAVIAINFHGSDSYGQNFTDSITGNYGSLPFDDLQLGLTEALRRYTYINESRIAALGASYGGFMINYIAGRPEMSTRFRTLVCHDGLFDMRGMAYSTEELWFSEHDAGNFTPYDNPEAFEKFNPVKQVANWTQPMLIIHGGRDYRVPDTQGIGAFTALQRRGIESRLLYLPNENHWTLNPFNSLIWYEEVLGWIGRKTE